MYHSPQTFVPDLDWQDGVARGDVVLFAFPINEDAGNAETTPKERQTAQQRQRSKQAASDPTGLSVAQGMRRRKYLLSGLFSCGQCGGKPRKGQQRQQETSLSSQNWSLAQ